MSRWKCNFLLNQELKKIGLIIERKRLNWHLNLGIDSNLFRFHDHEKLAHYADAACDIEFNFPFGFKELEGIHSRTDFDLKSHEELSGKKIQYFDPELDKNYTPYVLETSIGLDRMFLAIISNSFKVETLEDGSTRNVMSIPKQIAPNKLAILPLLKKDGLPKYAKKIMKEFSHEINLLYDEKDAIEEDIEGKMQSVLLTVLQLITKQLKMIHLQ